MTLIRPLDVILVILITAAAAGSFFLTGKEVGSKAEVYVDNMKAAVFNLDGPVQFKDIATKIGKVRVKYGNGSIQVTQSPCIQKICIHQGAISHTYENITCLPAQLQIAVIDKTHSLKSPDAVDAISY